MTPEEELEASIFQRLNAMRDGSGFRLILQAHHRPLDLTPSNDFDDDDMDGFYQTHRMSEDLSPLYDIVKDLEKLRDLDSIPFYYAGVQPPGKNEEFWTVQLVRPNTEPQWLKEYEALQAAKSKSDKGLPTIESKVKLG